MMDLKQAYSLLGLNDNAAAEELEKRYTLLIRRKRNRTEDEDRAAGEPTLSEINAAYRFIKEAAIQDEVRRNEPKNKTAGRIEYIFEYYRLHIIGTIMALILIAYTASSIIDNRSEEKKIARADLKISLFMDYQIQDPYPLKIKLLEGMKDWKDVYVTDQYAPLESKDEFSSAMLQKAFIMMSADKSDLYIMDKGNFEKFGKLDAFLNLDGQPEIENVAKDRKRSLEVDNQGTVWVGVDVSASPALKSLNLPAGDRIAVVRVNGTKKDNALKALRWLAAP